MSFVVPADKLSWVDYDESCDFPIQNIPFGASHDEQGKSVPVTAIGDYVVSLRALEFAGLLPGFGFLQHGEGLDTLLAEGTIAMRQLRRRLAHLFDEDVDELQDNFSLQEEAFVLMDEATLVTPFTVQGYADFYSGIHHASNVGRMFRPDQPPLLPNYKWIPIAYNGRSSTLAAEVTEVVRPKGQLKRSPEEPPIYAPTEELDFELELGYAIGGRHGRQALSTADAEDVIAGLFLVNDWSARDVQRWEYQPLGPFLAKSFATTMSPWLVSLDALEPFRIQGMAQDPEPLDYLRPMRHGHFDIALEVAVKTAGASEWQVITRSNTQHLYWSIFQQVAHLTSNGTLLRPGDVYASGTISGETEGSFGSLLELTWRGQRPIAITETGESRTFLLDGDAVRMTAYAQADGYRIGFGSVTSTVMPAT